MPFDFYKGVKASEGVGNLLSNAISRRDTNHIARKPLQRLSRSIKCLSCPYDACSAKSFAKSRRLILQLSKVTPRRLGCGVSSNSFRQL